ncbi:SpoIIE family protein phosphatase [Streptomyces thermolilacinus]|uniref:protein-serine/threonine phosphatase n=1 Tax=Streptomyces thermolilacinus SPC6 TaxID=1306406 RepID=A0A1D3DS85_9ACTN|nr:SpoIIE family protein phosphatase [Streptomyces thermolilacinus]OEJ95188.1 DNA-binding protein [Streptomyces thermolilacinus SPC6]
MAATEAADPSGKEPPDGSSGTSGGRAVAPSQACAAALGGVLRALGTAAYLVDEGGRVLDVNAHAEALLRRSAAELVGRDAHDLLHRDRHGELTPRARCPVREAILAGRARQGEEQWLERGDGSLLPVSWLATPCAAGDGTATLVVFHAEEEAAVHLPDESPEPAASLSELERLALLAETTTALTSTLDVDEALRRLVALAVPRLADWAVIDLITEQDEVWRTAVVHAKGDALVHREDLEGPMPPVPEESPMPLSRALRGVSSALAGPETYQGPPDSGVAVEQRRLFEETGMHSAVIAPIRGLREVLGALTLGRSERPEAFTAADVALLEDITRRAGLALANARLYQRQRKVAETMQRHLLPQLPIVPGLGITARYLAAPDASHVGGDWYDAFTLSDGVLALAIGDVVGHDLDAAAGMAQLRNMLRAYAWSQTEPPSKIVDWLDHASLHIAEVSMATMTFGRLTVSEDGRCELSWTNAGHPPPLLVTHDGVARYLTDAHGVLLGLGAHRVRVERTDATAELPPGSTLLLYTDGLIEEPGRSLDEGLDRLRRHAASLAHRPLESFTDELLQRARPPQNEDDVALLALRVPS